MKYLTLLSLVLLTALSTHAQLRVSADGRRLETTGGKPFFWLGDTAWNLFHRLNREEADRYLKDRADKGFTVIQAVVLAELDGLNSPNPYGERPLFDNDPARPNEAYFRHVDYVIKRAAKLGLVVGLLPSWGDKWNKAWGVGPEVFTPDNARSFGEFLGRRYRQQPVVWIMGGDRDCVEPDDFAIIRAMAGGIKAGDGGAHLMTFHPQGGKSSSNFFPDDEWIDFHMSQTGHSSNSQNYTFNEMHLAMTPPKPHLDGEPRYEDHPNGFKPGELGWMDDFDTRQCAYWSMLSGAFGHTYGNHNIWQFYTEERKPVSWARTHWTVALDHPGARQVGLMRRLFESRPWHRLAPDQSVILSANPRTTEYNVAAVSRDGDFLMVYLPYGRKIEISTEKLKKQQLRASWFNPRDGRTIDLGTFENTGRREFAPHSEGRGSDWVLVVE